MKPKKILNESLQVSSSDNYSLEDDENTSDSEWNDESESTILKSKVSQKLKFKCTVENCEAVYRKQWLLDAHIRKHNNERPFHCNVEECTKSFTRESHLKRHTVMVHEKACEQICDVNGCGLVYNNKYSLKKHKNQVHNAVNYPFFCNECSIGFKKKRQLHQHNYIHTGDPPFKCTICNIGFTAQSQLTKHNTNHKTYTCNCGQIFHRWSGLRTHKKVCSVKQDNICSVCHKTFNRKENLNDHMHQVHQDTTFQCPYMDCTRSYQYRKNLKFHVSVFHEKKGEEELPCPKCGKIFFRQIYLNRHIKTMHNDLPKIKKPRAPRKDKNVSRTFTAAALVGLKLSQKEHMELLKNSNKTINVTISELDLTEQTVKSKDNSILESKKNSRVEHEKNDQERNSNDLKNDQERNSNDLKNDQERNSNDLKNDMFIQSLEISDDVLIACNSVLSRINEYLI